MPGEISGIVFCVIKHLFKNNSQNIVVILNINNTFIRHFNDKSLSSQAFVQNITPTSFKNNIDDFITKGKRNIGLKFLIQWVDNAFFYQICEVSMNLTSAILKPHLESKRVFVKDESHKLFKT